MFKLNNLKAPSNSHFAGKRKGRGIGSGNGKTGGRGHKGQKARSGSGPNVGFEGGQMPIQRKAPKFGFTSLRNASRVRINVNELGAFAGKELSLKDIMSTAKVGDTRARVSIFGSRAPKAWPKSVEAHHLAPAARAILEKNSVTIKEQPYWGGRLGVKRKKAQ